MTAPQFGEPWVIEEIPREAGYYRILNRHGQSGEPIRTHGDPSRMVRVVACVNALAGVAHPERLGNLLAACREIAAEDDLRPPRRRHPKLVAALAALTDDAEVGNG